jgi:hypothetical protein
VIFSAYVSATPPVSSSQAASAGGGPVLSGAYVYLEEHLRFNGIAPLFTTGIRHQNDGCISWTGSYRNGIRWLGMQRGHIGIMLTSNSLSEGRLVMYARSQFCK